MVDGYAGRGAWPTSGAGGTLTMDSTTKATKPGRFYMLSTDTSKLVGLAAYRALKAGTPADLNELAVYYGVRAIQTGLVQGGFKGADGRVLTIDGILGKNGAHAIKAFQTSKQLTADGVFGPASAKAMFRPLMDTAAFGKGVPADLLCGHVTYESGVDPGAVGRSDSDDLGMGQINGRAHPDLSIEDRFNPLVAFNYVAGIIRDNLAAFPANVDDAIAAYNLGRYGCQQWIAAGRPEMWTPAGATTARNVWKYISAVKDAC